jgi:hypothetical protein
VRKKEIAVLGLDCIEGTPVLDIKPYLPCAWVQGEFDCSRCARGRNVCAAQRVPLCAWRLLEGSSNVVQRWCVTVSTPRRLEGGMGLSGVRSPCCVPVRSTRPMCASAVPSCGNTTTLVCTRPPLPHPDCDAVPYGLVPDWVSEGTGRAVAVTVTPRAAADMATHCGRCKLYSSAEAVWAAVTEVRCGLQRTHGCGPRRLRVWLGLCCVVALRPPRVSVPPVCRAAA